MAIPDREYSNLLSHLQRTTTSLPLTTIHASIAHHLAHLTPYPTPLAATVITSRLFRPVSHPKLQGLTTSFRHATHIKYKALRVDQGGLFSRSLKTRLRQWTSAVLKGIQGGEPIIRLACCGGLLLGLHDLGPKLSIGDASFKGNVEDEIVLALAEIMDSYANARAPGAWENEFQPVTATGEVDPLSLALLLASTSLPLVASEKVKALPLRAFARLLISTIDTAFHSGAFLSSLPSTIATPETPKVHIPETTPFFQIIQSISSSPLMVSIGPLSKLCARSLSLLLDSSPKQGITAVAETLGAMESLTAKVESDWVASPLSAVTDENDIAPDTRQTTKMIWTILKTLLFSTIMIADASLSTLAFIPVHIAQQSPPFLLTPSAPDLNSLQTTSASSLAQMTLHSLSHLCFVISQFGGVTSTSEGGFSELKKVFYLALDILAADKKASEGFVRQLCTSVEDSGPSSRRYSDHNRLWHQAKKAYVLAIIEQLVAVISEECIELLVLPLCLPHLSDTTHRETFELSHSVVLTVFGAHAQRVGESLDKDHYSKENDVGRDQIRNTGFTENLVPFYTKCLIENSADGKLSTPQLRLAFSALVRSASAHANAANVSSLRDDRYTLAWFCIDSLLDIIRTLREETDTEERLHRLHLTLISAIPSLPLTLLPRAFSEVRAIIVDHATGADHKVDASVGSMGIGARKRELIEALFDEILERVADREKEFALRWWYDNREGLGWREKAVDTTIPSHL